jgi:beta-glucosidase
MSTRIVLIAGILLLRAAGQTPVPTDPSKPIERRVAELLSRMTLEEKVSQMLSDSPGIDRLGIPQYDWWNECLHGVARAGLATVFPEPIGLAATFDENLIFRMASAVSDEARAKHHEFVRQGKRGIYEGLTFWTPNINLFRDPRWGRGMETYGEDPYLTGRLAVQFIRGLQGDDPRYLKTIATAKHYAVHSGPESTRHVFDAEIDLQDLRDTYLPQFEAAVRQGGAKSVMCAYNSVLGAPACASTLLLTRILRGDWNFRGYVVSDCGAIGDIYQTHKAEPTEEAGVAAAVKAGTDLDCGREYERLVAAVQQGLLAEKDIDSAVGRLLTARFKLGMFDPPDLVPYTKIPYSVNDSPAHGALALATARKSIVLLKNQGSVLPLDLSKLHTIAVIGPNANSIEVLLGNYNGEPSHPVTPLDGIRQKVGRRAKVLYTRGSDLAPGMPALETIPAAALFTTAEKGSNGLTAEYFNSADFNGRAYFGQAFVSAAMRKAAHPPETTPKPVFTRVDPQVDFNWRAAAPRPDMNDDNFGVRWTGYLRPPASGKYQLGVAGMNAFELYLDEKLLVRANNVHEKATNYAEVALDAGKLYRVRLDFHEVHGAASIQLVWSPPNRTYEDEALRFAQQSDVVLMFLGLSPRLEGEEMKVNIEGFRGGDRVWLRIPEIQEALLKKVAAVGKPVVLILLNGSAVAVNWARDHIPAIVELWYPGQAGGTALADVLFGDYNPAGRLPVTFYKSETDLPLFEDYNMKGRTYRYFQGEPLYPFGYGLSYSKFTYRNMTAPDHIETSGDMKVSVQVRNVGPRDGEEVIQLYVKHAGASVPVAIRSLEGFQRIALRAGEEKTVVFTLSPRELSIVGNDGQRMVEPGDLEIAVGGKQPGFTGAADASTTEVLTRKARINGAARILERAAVSRADGRRDR